MIDVAEGRFVDAHGRHVVLRGLNLGGDCKIPYPDGGTHLPSDFADHRSVSFVGRPFPLPEADDHFARIASWGFNCLRFLVTWEAIEHEGPGCYDTDYLEYVAALCRRAAAHRFVIFIDFHQDVWSRMTGGDGAPGWVFEAVGLDFTRFDAAGAAHVMQRRYDYSSGEGRQESRYPMMSWSRNYRLPANGILWTAFFAGATLTPHWTAGGVNVQGFLQRHYLGAMAALAKRLADIPEVIGFDTLNEPSLGFIGQRMSEPQLAADRDCPIPVRAGPCWTPFAALRAAAGEPVELPVLGAGEGGMQIVGSQIANPEGVSIWLPGVEDPFERAGAWTREGGAARVRDEDFFRRTGGRAIDPDADLVLPFHHAVAATIRNVCPDWLVFAEANPYQFTHGRGFAKGMPARTVNASHWYDVDILWRKSFDPAADRAALSERYRAEMAMLFDTGAIEGAPRLLGEFGIPYDLDGGRSFARWAAGERGEAVWDAHAAALGAMYDAIDALLLNSTQWTYTASNRNDLRIGDGWNQEDLSVYSADQVENGDGARGRSGFARPYVERAQGVIRAMRFDSASGRFEAEIDVDPAIAAPSEIVLPEAWFPGEIVVSGAECRFDGERRRLIVAARARGLLSIAVEPATGKDAKGESTIRYARA
ncbi:cellulase family glycosylhydrolase [Sphingomonas sp.]|uniref:glycoside hydrolase family 5 protein n=1 Tax=Sphingomonas sp. TaxID=28214 RepID=UPI001B2E56B9|nr:cellulase family glycosylhydrolase [Sphingomonas sp.]MBO9713872.1 cellulase family glycosylhydrolase [Sphingomonas sp.]